MTYTEDELEIIASKRKDLRKIVNAPLDSLIVEFLKRYDVNARPITSETTKVKDAIIAGAIGGALGADVGGDAFIVRGQNKQTQVQEWTTWKQWALDHKDFQAFKKEADEKIEKYNAEIDKKLSDPKFQKEVIEPLLKADLKFRKYEAGAIAASIGILTIYVIAYNSSVYEEQQREKYGFNSAPETLILRG